METEATRSPPSVQLGAVSLWSGGDVLTFSGCHGGEMIKSSNQIIE